MEYFGIKDLSDIILEVENPGHLGDDPIQFACHKVILAEASTTFKNIVCKGDLKVGLYLGFGWAAPRDKLQYCCIFIIFVDGCNAPSSCHTKIATLLCFTLAEKVSKTIPVKNYIFGMSVLRFLCRVPFSTKIS